ncbi:ficolin-2-like [Mizuhopecten yessoensis]|uniref:ficolin-2-like n=1 Tax=Mizuhopecten yessoensis TaxID=6573 RepID=UPI000B45C987|nr:ficolin-2-like [Mizuhopecten yessoensis]
MDTDGAGWTVFQRRIDGDVDFYMGWNDYKVGFGDVADEFWLGNENLYLLTSLGETEMRIDLEDFENITVYADYASFWVGDETTSYRLHVSGFSGSAKDTLAYHNGSAFTTKDDDNDICTCDCATMYTGAWWYRKCHYCNLNGQYLSGITTEGGRGLHGPSGRVNTTLSNKSR